MKPKQAVKKPKETRAQTLEKKRCDDNWLKKDFMHLNAQFFDNRLPGSMTVRFKDKIGHYNEHSKQWDIPDGYFSWKEDTIYVDRSLEYSPDSCTITLLHEMVHADLRFRGYIGYDIDGGHGMIFKAEIMRLINAGAYDGLL
jgi:hypothetical protein